MAKAKILIPSNVVPQRRGSTEDSCILKFGRIKSHQQKCLHSLKVIKCQHQWTVTSYICIWKYLVQSLNKSIQGNILKNVTNKSEWNY